MRIEINRKPGTLTNEVYILSDDARYQSFFTFENGQMIGTQFPQADIYNPGVVKPAFEIEEQVLRELIEAFMSLGANRGIEKPSEAKNAGKLEATERHLQDMRTLLKLK